MPAWTAATAASPGGTGFGALVAQGIASVDQDLAASAAELQSLASGQAGSLHRTMAKLEETRLSFQLFMQVRNRVLEAYQEVMKMQV
ncbi:flagellar hook-basal body complex protein FliE [Xylophilus rhododendri]|uniref:Flagellar hook-basal body complex protein FliE n=2 Tax=Xylophilus rhododendri TaxID=2697032 RepID=A0A857JC38_9BURK|nr:flagellar hook-basal body complex protein FliE [Xylophilus rhododendri]